MEHVRKIRATAAILAGGKSSRMGRNKALLPIRGIPVIEHILIELVPRFDEVMIITNDPDAYRSYSLPLYPDLYPGKGPLAGIHRSLLEAKHEKVLVSACDMPFISGKLATFLIEALSPSFDAVIPIASGKSHPLFAAYERSNAKRAETFLSEDQLAIRHFLSHIRVRWIEEEEMLPFGDPARLLFNMNGPQDYEYIRED